MATLKNFKYSGGYSPAEFCTAITFEDDTVLKDEQKDLFVSATASAASKSLVLGLSEGQHMILTNGGETNAFTAKNLSTDTGTSIAAGKVALVIGSSTANGTKIYVLN